MFTEEELKLLHQILINQLNETYKVEEKLGDTDASEGIKLYRNKVIDLMHKIEANWKLSQK